MFSPAVLDHVANPRNAGPLDGATHEGTAGYPGDGPYLTIWLKIDGQEIQAAHYQTYGCPAAVACGSALCQLVIGRTVGKAKLLDERDLLLILGGLPEGKEHCPQLGIGALRGAIGD